MTALKVLMMASSSGILSYHLTRLSIGLNKKEHDVTVLSGPKEQVEGLSVELVNIGVEHLKSRYLDEKGVYSVYEGSKDIQRILKMKEFDIIHANGAIHALEAYLAVKSLNKKPVIVTSVHSIPRRKYLQDLEWALIVKILNKCSNVITPVSNYTKGQLIRHGVDNQKTITIYNSIDLDAFDKDSQKTWINLNKNDEPAIACVGNLTEVKGQQYYLMASAKVLKHYSAKFYVIGDGPLRLYLEDFADRLGIEKNVVFTGRIHWPEIYYVLSNIADICVSSSISENFPFYTLECMAARKPIVATNVGGISEAVIDGVSGYLAPPKDPSSMAEAITKLIEDPEKAKKMGREGRRILEQNFSMSVITDKLSHVYELALKEKHS
jgi:glycosyltransferase involved in cell wall biosynthesis